MEDDSRKSITIRPAAKGDCAEVVRMIKELAVLEKRGDQFKMTTEVLERDGFGEDKYFSCLVAENPNCSDGSALIGYGLYYFTYSTYEGRCVFLENAYVDQEFRGYGVGTRIFKAVAKVGLELDCCRFCWSVLNWNTPAVNFYKKIGAVDMTEKEGCSSYRMIRPVMEEFVKPRRPGETDETCT